MKMKAEKKLKFRLVCHHFATGNSMIFGCLVYLHPTIFVSPVAFEKGS